MGPGLLPAEDPPNVLLIITDDQGFGDLGIHGNPVLKTPHLDRLAGQSVRFDQFHVNPLCAPTRAALLTGRYSLRTGTHGVARGQETLRAEERTLGEVFRDAGWRTGYFGKWHNGEHDPHTPTGQGFEESFGFNLGHWNNYFDTTLLSNDVWVSTSGYIADVLTDAALRFIHQEGEAPWFCYLAYNTPHSPFQVPDKYFDRYKALGLDDKLACVYGMCANLDDNIGRVLQVLDDTGQGANTIVVFMSDNGPNGVRYNAGMRGKKGDYHLGGIRVPCFIRWPANLQADVMVTNIAAHIDVLPTLMELCDIEPSEGLPLDGRSLVSLLAGDSVDWPDRKLFFQNSTPAGTGGASASVRTQDRHLVRTWQGWQLFDLTRDPGEETDVTSREPERAVQLQQAYATWYEEISKDIPPQRLPVPVGRSEAPRVELSVAQAELQENVRYSGEYPNNAWAIAWTSKGAGVEWRIDVQHEGDHVVVLQYLCTDPEPGKPVVIAAGDQQRTLQPAKTGRVQVDSPDRVPRGEVYELEWQRLGAGTLRLTHGIQSLSVTAPEGCRSFELKGVVLERTERTELSP